MSQRRVGRTLTPSLRVWIDEEKWRYHANVLRRFLAKRIAERQAAIRAASATAEARILACMDKDARLRDMGERRIRALQDEALERRFGRGWLEKEKRRCA